MHLLNDTGKNVMLKPKYLPLNNVVNLLYRSLEDVLGPE
jgi:hypothetical protein